MLPGGLACGTDLIELLEGLAALHPQHRVPGQVFLRLAADALEWCGATRAEPLPLEGLRERFLPEGVFRGRQNARLLCPPVTRTTGVAPRRPQVRRRSFMTGQVSSRHAAMAASSRSAACRAGTCTLHPIRCSSRSIPASVYRAPNRCHTRSAILVSVQHWTS